MDDSVNSARDPSPQMPFANLRRYLFLPAAIFILILSVFSNSLHNDFMMDDHGLILHDSKIRSIKYLHYQFIPEKHQYLNIEDGAGAAYYRPFAHVAIMICYLIFENNVLGYHFINCILFLLCVMAIYSLIHRLFKDRECAWLVSLLYVAHPLNGLFVNYITASGFAIQMIAMAGSMTLFLKVFEQQRNALALLTSVLLYALGLLCHETTLALPFYMFVTVWLLGKRSLKRAIFLLSPYTILTLGYLFFRFQYASLRSNVIDKLLHSDITAISFVASNIKLFFWYVSKFFYWDGIVIKWTTPAVTKDFVVWFFMFAMVIALWFYYLRREDKVKLWGLSVLLLGFLPVLFGSSFELKYGFILEPHWLFFPSIGMFVILAQYLMQLKKVVRKNIRAVFILSIMMSLILFSRHLNTLWGDEIKYCRYWLEHSPQQKSAVFYLASALMKEGKLDDAREAYHRALEGRALDWQIYVNLSLIAQQQGNTSVALQELNRALELHPKSSIIANNLGVLYKNLGDLDRASGYFRQAIKYNPYLLESRLNLASVYVGEKRYIDALDLYNENLLIDPKDEESLLERLKVLLWGGQREAVMPEVENILKASYSSALYLRLAVLMSENGLNRLALGSFQRALERDPNKAEIYIEMGKFFGNMDQFDDAISIWEEALRLDRDNQDVKDLILKARAFKNESREAQPADSNRMP